jgi:hypothetical protein
MGSFLVMGLFGVILASLVKLFMASSALQFVISVVGVLVFAGLTAWERRGEPGHDQNGFFQIDPPASVGRMP